MLEAELDQPAELDAELGLDAAISVDKGHYPATRERLGEVVVGDGLDVQPSGLLSVSQQVRDGDYATAANKPKVNGVVLDGDLRIRFATEADVLRIFQ